MMIVGFRMGKLKWASVCSLGLGGGLHRAFFLTLYFHRSKSGGRGGERWGRAGAWGGGCCPFTKPGDPGRTYPQSLCSTAQLMSTSESHHIFFCSYLG